MNLKITSLKVMLFAILLSLAFHMQAGEVVLYGTAKEWAGNEITFYSYKDLITKSEERLATTKMNEDGSFELKIPLKQTLYIFTHLGIYNLYLYAHPGDKYELVLPPYKKKSEADLLNPYFQEVIMQVGIANINDHDINLLIRMFDDSYEPYYNKHVVKSVSDKDFSKLDQDIQKIDAPFASDTNSFFKEYRRYKYAYLRYLALQHKVTAITEMYFTGKPVLYHNPAYMDLFNQVFDDYFLYHGRTDEGKQIFEDINSMGSYSSLWKTLKKNKVFKGDTLLELVILKNLFEEFYNDQFSRNGILQVLDSLASKTKIPENKMIAQTIRSKITRLLSGFPPPNFELYDLDSNLVSLSDFKGKYLYLNFCSCSSYTCLKEFELLQDLYERHKNRLQVVTIAVDSYAESLSSFLQKHSYHWEFLYYGHNASILKDYDIRAFPTYFLIGPDGKLIMSPAPGPNENFESRLFEVMKSRGDL